jgi:DnaK suppressor protein
MELTPGQIDQLRDELLRALAKLERSMKISDRAARPVELDQTAVGRLSRIDALQNQGITQGLQAREAARYAQVTHALQRLEQGTYGRCTGCRQTIPFERLLVFPEALTCAACGAG